MMNSSPLRISLLTLLIILTGSFSAMADDCPDLIEGQCSGGSAWFGLRYDGAVVSQGQTVTLVCDSAVLSAEFMFIVNGNSNVGVPSMVAGDEIHLALADSEGNHMVTATAVIPSDIFDGWLNFVFTENFVVPAGQYQLLAYTTVERQCGFRFAVGVGADCYEGGNRVASLNGINGPWFDFGANDTPFRLNILEDVLPNVSRTWDSIKGLYR